MSVYFNNGINKVLSFSNNRKYQPIIKIPEELLPLIFYSFSCRELGIASLVCRKWHVFIAQHPIFSKIFFVHCAIGELFEGIGKPVQQIDVEVGNRLIFSASEHYLNSYQLIHYSLKGLKGVSQGQRYYLNPYSCSEYLKLKGEELWFGGYSTVLSSCQIGKKRGLNWRKPLLEDVGGRKERIFSEDLTGVKIAMYDDLLKRIQVYENGKYQTFEIPDVKDEWEFKSLIWSSDKRFIACFSSGEQEGKFVRFVKREEEYICTVNTLLYSPEKMVGSEETLIVISRKKKVHIFDAKTFKQIHECSIDWKETSNHYRKIDQVIAFKHFGVLSRADEKIEIFDFQRGKRAIYDLKARVKELIFRDGFLGILYSNSEFVDLIHQKDLCQFACKRIRLTEDKEITSLNFSIPNDLYQAWIATGMESGNVNLRRKVLEKRPIPQKRTCIVS